jgi:hypothetical protein
MILPDLIQDGSFQAVNTIWSIETFPLVLRGLVSSIKYCYIQILPKKCQEFNRMMNMFDQNRLHELISAIQKSIRWCEVNASRYFAQDLINMGAPHAVFGQLRIIAAEDIGLADPSVVGYVGDCLESVLGLMKQDGIKKEDFKKHPNLCDIIDRAVIAEAISYKSRLLPLATFSTLYDIYNKENFNKSNYEYFNKFVVSLEKEDEKQALYYAFIVDKIFNEKRPILRKIRDQSNKRNSDLIQEWIDEYEKHDKLLNLSGSIVMLCRDLNFTHGEYKDDIHHYLSIPIKVAEIPDRAYDKHTATGKKKGRGFEYFFNVSATVKNERFSNDWETVGKKAVFSADREELADDDKIIKAIKTKRQSGTVLMTV